MNIVCIAGQLGKDMELRYLNNAESTAVGNFSVADDQGRDKPTIWWNCQLFGKRAESLAQYLVKGQKVTVTGQLTEREYTDRDGAKKVAREIRVQDVALQGGQRQEATERPAKAPSERENNLARQHAIPNSRPVPNFSDMDDEIPF
jgi:single-strand DNA-binding protein